MALWVLENVDAAIRNSMSAIAQATDVSDTTVLRMCRTAGFEGFTDLKLALAQEPRDRRGEAGSEPQASDLQAAVRSRSGRDPTRPCRPRLGGPA